MGIDWTKEYVNPGGRPLYIANSIDDVMGQPLHELGVTPPNFLPCSPRRPACRMPSRSSTAA